VKPALISVDSAWTTGNFAPLLTEEPGVNIAFCPGTFQGPTLIFEAKAQQSH